VAPGRYQVRLSIGSWSRTQPLEVKIDPRVTADGVTQNDLEEQAALSLRIRDAISQVLKLAERVGDARDKAADDRAASTRLQQLHDKLVTGRGAYPQPMLIDQLANIARMIGQADQRVGRDAYVRFNDLLKELAVLEAEVSMLIGSSTAQAGR
jgi:hypothetical protein